MSDPIATYSFLPWLRQGIANYITAKDGDPNVKLRATIPVTLELTGEAIAGGNLTESITKNVELYCPGDIAGLSHSKSPQQEVIESIIKIEPRNWITNFEPNYLPYIDFYPEDFPWRYTPAAPDQSLSRLRPWIMLVVLKEDEFKDGANIRDKPLPFIEVANPSVFPPAEQLWAWAHVHVNRSLADDIVSKDMGLVLSNFQGVLNESPDLAYSRILCPRKLEPNAGYHAFLIPVFETGRLAGLGLNPANAPNATFSAWANYGSREASSNYPYYYRWYFRTGTLGDFEYLVRLLKPKPVDRRVGTRDMDVLHPGSNLPRINIAGLDGILKLGGALRPPLNPPPNKDKLSPEERMAVEQVEKSEIWDRPYPHPFQEALAALINLADDYAIQTAQEANTKANNNSELDLSVPIDDESDENQIDPDPLITPPLYGRWHALTQRLLKDRAGNPLSPNDNWVHQLNLDPRYRVSAGFGTKVIQKYQEEYMNAAWEQIGEVLEANRRIRLAQLAKEISWIWYDRHLRPLRAASLEKALVFTAPVHKRVISQGFTVYHQMDTSVVPTAVTSVAMRRIVRPRGRLLKSLPFGGRVQPDTIIERINNGEVTAAPPKKTPSGIATVDDVSKTLLPPNVPPFIVDLLRRFPWLQYLPLLLALLIVIGAGILGLGGIAIAFLVALFGQLPLLGLLIVIGVGILGLGGIAIASLIALFRQLQQWVKQIEQADSIREENQTPEAVDRLPKSPDFVLTEPGSGSNPSQGTTDSAEAVRFKTGLKDLYSLLGASRKVGALVPKDRLNLPTVTDATVQTINPEVAIPRRLQSIVLLPDRLKAVLGEEFQEVMAYPEIDIPMYLPLSEGRSSELFLPNINLVEQNSITLLETNQKFIEAYMVGLNHEFARELLWREYPTDQRGSYFRQFWDVSSFFDTENLNKEQLKEKLRDIPPIHRWRKDSKLGEHDNREEEGIQEEDLVLVIRGELLKKYPTAVIYAQKARWQTKDGKIDKTQPRQLVQLEGAEADNPPRDKVKTPLYGAKVDPDIYFLGFDLTASEAKGGTGERETDDPGWFFVIKERPGEPRFGLDIDKSNQIHVWNDLSWEDVLPGEPGTHIKIDRSFSLIPPPSPPQNSPPDVKAEAKAREQQYDEDKKITWDANTNSADLAYILYQVPVLVAVHASELLPPS
ncbi:hypothetical protein [Nostoc sp. 106C]|uniref:hypothetical protein n=1 Tax=Nostoc sp. 106C TaxID=1932667 RepID=UPI000A3612FC|nr:hypothetical protein [Nostoc sp. 106C]OUL36551.1 hypothetical protein BV375_00040 [Nostoc sp. 106C]